MRLTLYSFLSVLLINAISFSQQINVLESSNERIKIEVNFDNTYTIKDTLVNGSKFTIINGGKNSLRIPGEPWLPNFSAELGIQFTSNLKIKIISKSTNVISNKMILPYPDVDLNGNIIKDINYNKDIYNSAELFPNQAAELSEPFVFRFAKIQAVVFSPFQFNPITREIIFNRKIVVEIKYNTDYNKLISYSKVEDKLTDHYLKDIALNYASAKEWYSKVKNRTSKLTEDYWYNPNKTYYKIIIDKKDVYRISYQDLINAGAVIADSLKSYRIEIFNSGEQIPLDVTDGGDGIFGPSDYFQFIGYPPPKSEYSYFNLYNLDNVYWLSLESDTNSLRYESIDAFPSNYNITAKEIKTTVHFERDSLFERLGYAPDPFRDFWFWDRVSGSNGVPTKTFRWRFNHFPTPSEENTNMTVRVNMHGMNNLSCAEDHKADILLTDQYLGTVTWDGQTAVTYTHNFLNSIDSIQVFPVGNYFEVSVDGNTCNPNAADEIRVNWFEFDYWKENRSLTGNSYFFQYTPNPATIVRFQIWDWERGNVKVYVPSKNRILTNPLFWNDQSKTFTIKDTVAQKTDYFCVADDYYSTPKSITPVLTNSNLRNTSNGADYLIITHGDFIQAAQRLADFRQENLIGFNNPRIKIINIDDIYNEFSYGLLNPMAVKDFVQYTFDNWSGNPPSYVVLMGDNSYDYRGLLETSRKNFIPSLPYHALRYGLAFSDNNFVTVSGDDYVPDIAIGRISCETLEEANILVDKIMRYPEDDSKEWRENIILMGAGEDEEDENRFGFNDDNIQLQNTYVYPNGYTTTKVFRYPNKQEYIQYQGQGPEIREAFNKGGVLSNFYGHGGGGQWDLVFTNDDIYLLDNGGKMPVVLSVSCYTAHFVNQTAFGEIFNRVPGKGSIGFWGNTGLTFYGYGKSLNNALFDQVFNVNNLVIGDAILGAKIAFAGNSTSFRPINDHLSLFTYLGDPAVKMALPDKPDFKIYSSDIKITPQNPIVGDSVTVKTKISNLGRIFPGDSVTVQFFVEFGDTSYLITAKKIGSFADKDSIIFGWTPENDGLANLRVEVNRVNIIDEMDESDNVSQTSFTVFDLKEPNIIKPSEGYFTSSDSINFLFGDIGYYVDLPLKYYIEIDTSIFFLNPAITVGPISPDEGLLKFTQKNLTQGEYFWRTRLFDGNSFSPWANTKTFSVKNENDFGYLAEGRQLETFQNKNFIYSDSSRSLKLNTNLLPPRPSTNKIMDTIKVIMPSQNYLMTSITTDGTFIYYANKSFYNGFQSSSIYKIGSGYNSVQGQSYDSIPNFSAKILNQIFYHNGFIYVIDGHAYKIIKLDPVTGDSSYVSIPSGMLDNTIGTVENFNSAYMCSDGSHVFNIAFKDSSDGSDVFVIREFDPSNNWNRVGSDLRTTSMSWGGQFSGFFVAKGYIYPYENFRAGWMRRIRLSDGFFEEEFLTNSVEEGFQAYHAWCYDPDHDVVYASVARTGFAPQIRRFFGSYKESSGFIVTPVVGQASKWNKVKFNLNTAGYTGDSFNYLLGLNSSSKLWDTLVTDVSSGYDISNINVNNYKYLRMIFDFIDTTNSVTPAPSISKFKLEYESLPEIILTDKSIEFPQDSLLQGLDVPMELFVSNVGYSTADSLNLFCYLNNSDTSFFTSHISLLPNETKELNYNINSAPLIFKNYVQLKAVLIEEEFFTFNNLYRDSFYVARDSIKPEFSITFDGSEVINGDIVSSHPLIQISLKDNSPLPLDTNYFFVYHNNNPLSFKLDSLSYNYTAYPNSEALVTWNPEFTDGKHILEVLAKDASGNFFDSTSYRVSFNVDTEEEVLNIYNYPNPFSEDTYFTFTLTGRKVPQEMTVRIYTIAGRLIRILHIPTNELSIGFNKYWWDGKDEDGNTIANGVYFYKFKSLINGEYVSEVKKLAKVR